MAVKSKPSRLESNKDVRRALIKCGVDMTKIHFSTAGRSVSLRGTLCKDGGKDIAVQAIEQLLQELQRLGLYLNCDLDNWDISESSIMKKGEKKEDKEKEKPAAKPAGGGQKSAAPVKA